jgi:hypothetical protein
VWLFAVELGTATTTVTIALENVTGHERLGIDDGAWRAGLEMNEAGRVELITVPYTEVRYESDVE